MKKDLKLIIIISVIVALLLGGGAYILLSGKAKKPTTEPVNAPSTTTTTTTTTKSLEPSDKPYGNYNDADDIKKILSTSFTLYGKCESGKEFSLNNNEATVNDLTEENIYHILFGYISAYETYTRTNKENSEVEYKINRDDLLEAAEALFGRNYRNTLTLKDSFEIYGTKFTLSKNVYTGVIKTDGCLAGKNPNYYLVDSNLDGNHYYLDFALYYLEYELKDNALTSKVYNSKDSTNVICKEEDISKNTNSLTKYRFSFIREGENFILEKITNI